MSNRKNTYTKEKRGSSCIKAESRTWKRERKIRTSAIVVREREREKGQCTN